MADKQNQQGVQGTTQGAPGQSRMETQSAQGPQRPVSISRATPMGSLGRDPWGASASPFSMMRRLINEMDSMFEDFGLSSQPFGQGMDSGMASRMPSMSARLWSPQIESFERGNQLVVRADLPGVSLDDLHVNVDGDVLTLSGERRSEHEETRGNLYRSERSYGTFQRALRLPEGIDANSLKASFDNGVLEITMSAPQRSTAARTIEVTPGGSTAAGSNVTTRGASAQKPGPAH